MALIAIPTSLQSVGQGQSAAFKVFAVIDRTPTIDAESEGTLNKQKKKNPPTNSYVVFQRE